jgi:positive regulator of sigma E activity
MATGRVTGEEIHDLRKIYEVLLRDAADVYVDIQEGIEAFAASAVVLTALIAYVLFMQVVTYRLVPPVTLSQLMWHVAVVPAYVVLAYVALRWYRRFFSMRKKYNELLKIAKEVKARQ